MHFSEQTQIVRSDRNVSFLPEGDTDEERAKERLLDRTSGNMRFKVWLHKRPHILIQG